MRLYIIAFIDTDKFIFADTLEHTKLNQELTERLSDSNVTVADTDNVFRLNKDNTIDVVTNNNTNLLK